MFARLTFRQVAPESVDEAITIFRRLIVPAMKQQPGNQGGRLLTDAESGKVVAVSFWDTEAALEAGVASGYVDQQLAKMSHLFLNPPLIENYEIPIRTSQPRSSFVRLTTLQIQPARLDEAIGLIRDAAAIVKQQPGCHGLTLMLQAATGKARAFTVWETPQDMLEGEANGFYQQQRAKLTDLLVEPPGPGEHFEVSVSVVTESGSPQSASAVG